MACADIRFPLYHPPQLSGDNLPTCFVVRPVHDRADAGLPNLQPQSAVCSKTNSPHGSARQREVG